MTRLCSSLSCDSRVITWLFLLSLSRYHLFRRHKNFSFLSWPTRSRNCSCHLNRRLFEIYHTYITLISDSMSPFLSRTWSEEKSKAQERFIYFLFFSCHGLMNFLLHSLAISSVRDFLFSHRILSISSFLTFVLIFSHRNINRLGIQQHAQSSQERCHSEGFE